MSRERPLQGGCSCGRNRYTIEIPQDATDVAQVFFDNSYANRRSQAAPLSAWLKVPLAWFHSSTHAFFDDETHAAIRRTFTPPLDPSSKRQFCGFCGTPLSFWSESPPSEADFISLTLGSLTTTDLHDLEDLGLLPKEALEEAKSEKEMIEKNAPQEGQLVTLEGVPWFETLVEGSKLGRMRRSSGHRRSRDGKVTVEWEIVEWTDDGGEKGNQSPAKRKLADMDPDSAMEQ